MFDGCSQSSVTMVQHRHAFCLTGYVEINDVKAEHPVRKLCPNNHMGFQVWQWQRQKHTYSVY